MTEISKMDNEEISTQLQDLSLTRLEKIFSAIHEKDKYLITELVKIMARKITSLAENHLRQVGYKYEWRYSDCKPNRNGWIDVTDFRPFPFDMTIVRVKRLAEGALKEVPAWWTGKSWESRKLKKEDSIKFWKLEPWGK